METKTAEKAELSLDVERIMKMIPHRYPFLMIDRVVEAVPDVSAVGIKNVTINEPFFQGHFPDLPIMPGVLMVEALAQVGAVAIATLDAYRDKLGLFAGIDGVRFRRTVIPGDTLRMEVVMTRLRGSIGKGQAKAWVGDELAVEIESLLFAMTDRDKQGLK